MKHAHPLFWTTLLSLWSGLAMAANDYGPGAMGDGVATCGGMMGMMGGFMMIIPAVLGLLLLATLVMAIMALAKYLRRG
jgi:uncharacterized membrane protein